MNTDSDVTSWLVALVLGVLGVAVIAAPFVAGSHALWIAFALTIGSVLLASAFAVVSPSLSGNIPPIRGGR